MKLIRHSMASLFRLLFRLSFLHYAYYGFHKRIVVPLNLFKGVKKKIRYRKKIVLELDIEDWIQQNLYFLNEYEEREIRFIERFLTPGDVFIDIGANIGLFSLVASHVVGTEGLVYAFEPFEKNYRSLVNHINLNRCRNVKAEKIAITDKEASIELYLDEKEHNLGMVTSFANSFSMKALVASTSLDTYFENTGNTKIALIKMDIEGGEYSALKGMEKIIKKSQPAVLIEIDPEILQNTSFTPQDVESLLVRAGYKKFFIGREGEIREKPDEEQLHNYLFLV